MVKRWRLPDWQAGQCCRQWTQFESFPRFMSGVHFIESRGTETGGWRGEVQDSGPTRQF
jgi:hypothetical protein